jgi:hypothetical protein
MFELSGLFFILAATAIWAAVDALRFRERRKVDGFDCGPRAVGAACGGPLLSTVKISDQAA